MTRKEQETANPKGISPALLISPQHRIFRHLLLLLILITVAFQLSSREYISGNKTYAIIQFLLFIGIIYFNMYVLAPRFLFKNKFLLYVGLVFASVIFAIFLIVVSQYATKVAGVEGYQPVSALLTLLNAGSIIISLGLIVAGSSAILLFERWIKHGQRIGELENATMKSELEQLKNQINPHFLFNMLNNANELTNENPDEAADILLKLNDLLKYQLNDSVKDEVRLNADIRFLNDFLNLEKIRRDNFEFIFSTEGNVNNVFIPPLLFIPFVENAVKHGNDNEKPSYIHLYFNVKGDELNFICTNSKPSESTKKNDKASGLGLANIKRRLELLYRQYHLLEISENEITYTVKLSLKL